jgi:cyclic pyranopterin phosphate synthase
MVEIYTDGAFNPVGKRGAWAAVIVENGKKLSLSGSADATSSSRMEIAAVVEGLQRTPPGSEITIYTDSQYVYNCASQGWKRKVNLDLWLKLDAATSERKVHWQWITGDSPGQYHVEAHSLATGAATRVEAVETTPEKLPWKSPENLPGPAPVALSHLDSEGRPRMVDVTEKADTEREAIARCEVVMLPGTLALLKQGTLPKGDVLTVAQIAGIMGAKQVPSLIPLCHPLLLSSIKVELTIAEPDKVAITTRVKNTGKTGVEMEALTAAAVAGLTIYDMCKAVDKGMRITNIRLIKKSGGKSGTIILEKE